MISTTQNSMVNAFASLKMLKIKVFYDVINIVLDGAWYHDK